MQNKSIELLRQSSHISGGNATYVEDLYESYLKDPNGVPEQLSLIHISEPTRPY